LEQKFHHDVQFTGRTTYVQIIKDLI
jgi:hypothetical protein